MQSKRRLVAAMVGLTMLALPAVALAGHHDRDDNPRPYAWHDQGWHHGWGKHHDRDDYRPAWNERRFYQPPAIWHHERDRDDYYRPRFWRHHEPDRDDYRANRGYWGGSSYRPPIAYYNRPGRYTLDEQRDLLIQRRLQAVRVINQMRARGDSRAAERETEVLQNLNTRLGNVNRRAGYGYRGTNYGYSGYAPMANPYFSNTYGSSYNPYYGNTNQYGNPMTGRLTSLVGPFLGMPY
jgi:hypothetical protein